MAFRDSENKIFKVITGYNWYKEIPQSDRAVTFSHMHEKEEYKQVMFQDLKGFYSREQIESYIREKGATYFLESDFEIFEGLRIKNIETDKESRPEEYNSVKDKPEFEGKFIGQLDSGWELDLPFREKESLLKIVNLFLRKSYSESEEHWPDAYETPVLLLGKKALCWKDDLPQFIQATKFILEESSNEISFVINKNMARLKELPQYKTLIDLGFQQELCLGNRAFIDRYVDKLAQ